MDDPKIHVRLDAFEARLDRLEGLLGELIQTLNGVAQLVETTGHDADASMTEGGPGLLPASGDEPAWGRRAAGGDGPFIPGTRIRCTDGVSERLRRIAVPFVREMVARKVAEAARAERVSLVDVAFFERAATF